jgi:AcrR family transcriptional regulator
MSSRRKVELLETNQPRQERAKRTYEGILVAAAELLVEVGVERISTNLIAERAGITVPALYRYFPNKYSVLHALGAKLMDQQNEVFQTWFFSGVVSKPEDFLDRVYDLLRLTCDVTLQQPGGLEIVQALRAVGPLQELRLTSHRLVGGQLAEILGELMGRPGDEAILLPARLSVDMGYSVVEMALEDDSLDTEAVLRQGALMIQLYWHSMLD